MNALAFMHFCTKMLQKCSRLISAEWDFFFGTEEVFGKMGRFRRNKTSDHKDERCIEKHREIFSKVYVHIDY